jgi:hypothetical protein
LPKLAPPQEAAPPELVQRVEPSLPPDLNLDHPVSGDFVVRATISGEGEVLNPVILSSDHPELEPYVLKAILKWRYKATGRLLAVFFKAHVDFRPTTPAK